MTDVTPMKDPTWALAVRPRSDDAVHAGIHMSRHLDEVPDVNVLRRHVF